MATRKQASKRAQLESNLQQLDALGKDPSQFVEESGMTLLESLCAEFIERVQNNIEKADIITTGKITDITMQAEGGYVNIYAPAHLIYKDRGVNGAVVQLYDTPHKYTDKKPPVEPIIEWLKTKKIVFSEKNDYHRKYDKRFTDEQKKKERPFKQVNQEEEIKRMAYAIREKIYQEGQAPLKLYSKEIPKLVEDVKSQLGDFVQQQLKQVIDVKPEAQRIIIK